MLLLVYIRYIIRDVTLELDVCINLQAKLNYLAFLKDVYAIQRYNAINHRYTHYKHVFVNHLKARCHQSWTYSLIHRTGTLQSISGIDAIKYHKAAMNRQDRHKQQKVSTKDAPPLNGQ